MIIKILTGLLAAIMSIFGLTGPATLPEKPVAAESQAENQDVQDIIDAGQAEAGHEFISVRYEGETAHIALNPDTYVPETDGPTFEAVSTLLEKQGYQVTAVL